MKHILSATLLFFLGSAQAALHDRGGGFIYDDIQDITWVQNPATTLGSSSSWEGMVNKAANLSLYDSVRDVTWDDWRLPVTVQPDPGCSRQFDPGPPYPLQGDLKDCSGSEMGHLFYVDGISQSSWGPFVSIGSAYWSGTEYEPTPMGVSAWYFGFNSGNQLTTPKSDPNFLGFAVRDGDVGPIPPATPVAIDVGPYDPTNMVKPNSNNPIVVAVMGSIDFDATQIRPASLRFGAGEAETITSIPWTGNFDNDTEGHVDAAFVFATQDTGIFCNDAEVTLTGNTYSSIEFAGTSAIDATDCVTGSCHPMYDDPPGEGE